MRRPLVGSQAPICEVPKRSIAVVPPATLDQDSFALFQAGDFVHGDRAIRIGRKELRRDESSCTRTEPETAGVKAAPTVRQFRGCSRILGGSSTHVIALGAELPAPPSCSGAALSSLVSSPSRPTMVRSFVALTPFCPRARGPGGGTCRLARHGAAASADRSEGRLAPRLGNSRADRRAPVRDALEKAERSAKGDGSRSRGGRAGGSLEKTMDGYFSLFTGLKILVVILFVVNTAAILTWGERRQCAMIQDRIGPNRAVIYLPGSLLKLLSLAIGFALAAAVAQYAWLVQKRPEAVRLDVGFGLTELAILLAWVGLVVLRRQARRKGETHGLGGALARIADARTLLYGGLVAHVVVALARALVADGEAAPSAESIQVDRPLPCFSSRPRGCSDLLSRSNQRSAFVSGGCSTRSPTAPRWRSRRISFRQTPTECCTLSVRSSPCSPLSSCSGWCRSETRSAST